MASEKVDSIVGRTPHPHGQYPLSASCIVYKSVQRQLNRESILELQHARQPPCLCGHSGTGYKRKKNLLFELKYLILQCTITNNLFVKHNLSICNTQVKTLN